MIAVRLATLLVACTLICADNFSADIVEEDHTPLSNPTINEDIGYMSNVMDEYRRHVNPRLTADNGPRNQEMYKLWKRNADIINTLLGFPRRMFIAGR